MRIDLFVLLLVFIASASSGCLLGPPKMIVENRCGIAVDSVVLFIMGQRTAATGRVPANETAEVELPRGSLSSALDLAGGAFGKVRKQIVNIDTWFTDLGANYSQARVVIEPGNRGRIVLK